MSLEIEGFYTGKGLKIAIVAARFNEIVTKQLVGGVIDCLNRHEVNTNEIPIAWVPGCFEIPIAAQKYAELDYDAVICIGAVIRGDTPHFDQVVGGVTNGVAKIALDSGKPIIYGVLTTDTVDQAMDRAGLKAGNKGWEAALTAIEMINLLKQIS